MNWENSSQLIYHHVKVKTKVNKPAEFVSNEFFYSDDRFKNLIYTGYLKALDPITKSAILCIIDNKAVTKNILILGHIIDKIQLSHEENAIPTIEVQQILQADTQLRQAGHPYFNQKASPITEEEQHKRRDEILSWLAKNRIPAVLDEATDDIIVADSVRIKAPYEDATDYSCPTRVVLKRIKQIVENR